MVACRHYAFIKISLTEANDICRDLGLKSYEMNPSQKWSGAKGEHRL